MQLPILNYSLILYKSPNLMIGNISGYTVHIPYNIVRLERMLDYRGVTVFDVFVSEYRTAGIDCRTGTSHVVGVVDVVNMPTKYASNTARPPHTSTPGFHTPSHQTSTHHHTRPPHTITPDFHTPSHQTSTHHHTRPPTSTHHHTRPPTSTRLHTRPACM